MCQNGDKNANSCEKPFAVLRLRHQGGDQLTEENKRASFRLNWHPAQMFSWSHELCRGWLVSSKAAASVPSPYARLVHADKSTGSVQLSDFCLLIDRPNGVSRKWHDNGRRVNTAFHKRRQVSPSLRIFRSACLSAVSRCTPKNPKAPPHNCDRI